MSFQLADTEGRFQFNRDFSGQPLEVGTYQVVAFANQYQQGQTDPFGVAEGEDRDVGDVPLQPFPVQFSNIVPCENLPPEGGRASIALGSRTVWPHVLMERRGAWFRASGSDLLPISLISK